MGDETMTEINLKEKEAEAPAQEQDEKKIEDDKKETEKGNDKNTTAIEKLKDLLKSPKEEVETDNRTESVEVAKNEKNVFIRVKERFSGRKKKKFADENKEKTCNGTDADET